MLSFLLEPYPIRAFVKHILYKYKLSSYQKRLGLGAVPRPHYGYSVYQAAALAYRLGYTKISVLEFGVAGGNGLLNLEYHAQEVEKIFPVEIEIYGFDLGEGLPTPLDYRDIPYAFQTGFYRMDVEALRVRLQRAKLILGDVQHTTASFFEQYTPAPIGAIFFDLDFYSSTCSALQILNSNLERYLPRLFTYFDDTVGSETQLYSDYAGERLAIHEFNHAHAMIKFSPAYYLLAKKIVEPWYHRMWIVHLFEHPSYSRFVGEEISHTLKVNDR